MQNNPLNTSPIYTFVQQVKAAEQSNQKEIKLDLRVAKNLVFCLTEVLAKLTEDQDTLIKKVISSNSQSATVSIEVDGGGF